MTVEEIEADLAALRQAKRQRLLGEQATKVSYSNGSSEFSVATLAELNGEIAKLELQLSRLTGRPSGLGPVRIGFGSRY